MVRRLQSGLDSRYPEPCLVLSIQTRIRRIQNRGRLIVIALISLIA